VPRSLPILPRHSGLVRQSMHWTDAPDRQIRSTTYAGMTSRSSDHDGTRPPSTGGRQLADLGRRGQRADQTLASRRSLVLRRGPLRRSRAPAHGPPCPTSAATESRAPTRRPRPPREAPAPARRHGARPPTWCSPTRRRRERAHCAVIMPTSRDATIAGASSPTSTSRGSSPLLADMAVDLRMRARRAE
jgi:hypothetical protein